MRIASERFAASIMRRHVGLRAARPERVPLTMRRAGGPAFVSVVYASARQRPLQSTTLRLGFVVHLIEHRSMFGRAVHTAPAGIGESGRASAPIDMLLRMERSERVRHDASGDAVKVSTARPGDRFVPRARTTIAEPTPQRTDPRPTVRAPRLQHRIETTSVTATDPARSTPPTPKRLDQSAARQFATAKRTETVTRLVERLFLRFDASRSLATLVVNRAARNILLRELVGHDAPTLFAPTITRASKRSHSPIELPGRWIHHTTFDSSTFVRHSVLSDSSRPPASRSTPSLALASPKPPRGAPDLEFLTSDAGRTPGAVAHYRAEPALQLSRPPRADREVMLEHQREVVREVLREESPSPPAQVVVPDLADLSRRVYDEIEQRVRIERERRGLA